MSRSLGVWVTCYGPSDDHLLSESDSLLPILLFQRVERLAVEQGKVR